MEGATVIDGIKYVGDSRFIIREFNYLGIASHRASHRRKREDCIIEFTYGNIGHWKYSELKEGEE